MAEQQQLAQKAFERAASVGAGLGAAPPKKSVRERAAGTKMVNPMLGMDAVRILPVSQPAIRVQSLLLTCGRRRIPTSMVVQLSRTAKLSRGGGIMGKTNCVLLQLFWAARTTVSRSVLTFSTAN